MDIYLADSQFTSQDIIDGYTSCIWTERFKDAGEFELLVPWQANLASDLKNYKYLTMSESNAIMMIENAVIDQEAKDRGENLVRVSGSSIEAFFKLRSTTLYEVGGGANIIRNSTRAAAANYLVDITVVSNPSAVYNLPGLSIAAPPSVGVSSRLEIARGELLSSIRDILEPDNLGFRIVKKYVGGVQHPGEIVFQVYAGQDWSGDGPSGYAQYRLYSPDDDTLTDISSLESIAGYKNHARVLGAKTVATVYAPGISSSITGFERRTMVIDASDIGPDSTTTVAEDQVALQERGLEVLAAQENKYQNLVDGDLTQNDVAFQNLGLGDLLQIKNTYGVQNKVRITEKIWTSDENGAKRLPTFEVV